MLGHIKIRNMNEQRTICEATHKNPNTPEDIEDFNASGLGNIVVDSRENRLILRLVGDREAERLTQEEGGLPV